MSMKLEQIQSCGVLCFGGEDWWYHNRGHCDMQFMRQFAKFGPVVYVNSIVMRKPNISEGRMFFRRVIRKAKSMTRGLVKVPEGFWVYSAITAPVHHLPLARPLNAWFLRAQVRLVMRKAGLKKPIVWVNCPASCDTALALPRTKLIYQRTDRYEEYPGVDRKQILYYDRKLKEHADLTFFSNQKLYEEERSQCRKAAYIDHGVDYDHFANAEKDPWIPPEMENLKHPIAGFYGGIDAHTFDMNLMAQTVEKLPDVTFVFIGKASIDCTPLNRHPNVVMIDQKPYDQIPHYGKCFDVCLMPWNQNEWIQACNPIKLKEYLSLGKPVVSAFFPQLSGYQKVVSTAIHPKDFSSGIRDGLSEKDSSRKLERQAFVQRFTWKQQANQIFDFFDENFMGTWCNGNTRPE